MICRKRRYSKSILKSNFFMMNGLYPFITNAIEEYCYGGSSVVDVGCGEQPFRELLKEKQAKYCGVDIKQNTMRTVDVISTAENLQIEDDIIDLVLCLEVLEHVNDVKKVVGEIKRILKPGGYCIITTPFIYPLHEEPYDNQRLTVYGLLNVVRQNQLEVVHFAKIGNEIEVFASMFNITVDNLISVDNLLCKVIRTLIRLPTNLFSLFISCVVKRYLPKKYYLNTVLIFKNKK